MSYGLYWGDSHLNLHSRDRKRFDECFQAARAHLDFLPIAYYPMDFYTTMEGLRVESWHNRPKFLEEWKDIQELCRRYYGPGRFVPFAGYEWHGNRTRWGDHNVFYFEPDNPLDDTEDIDDLYANLRKRRGLAIPHHIGYHPGIRAKDWDHYDPDLSPFAEMYSNHGLSETPVNRFPQPNYAMGPWTSGSTAIDALSRGLRLGLICSTDAHSGFGGVHGNGLMAVLAEDLTREGLWLAFMDRRVYGVTGDRIEIDYTVNGAVMGSEITSTGPIQARIRLVCPQALDRVEWVRNGRVLKTHCHQDGLTPEDASNVRCRIRIEPGWGPTEQYRFEVPPKEWEGRVSVSDGELSIVQGCWTDFGNSLSQAGGRSVEFNTVTKRNRHHPAQAFILEARGPRSADMSIEADPFRVSFTLDQALNQTQLWADQEGAMELTQDYFGIRLEDIENPDVFYHSAHKLRVIQAVPEKEFQTEVEFSDPEPPPGRNWYYARVSELNGQMAWTSPVWVEQK